jgi:hypothetical protein
MALSEKEQQVVGWRKETLIRAGWEPAIALHIASKLNIDLRLAEAVIGCGDEEQALYLLSLSDKPSNKWKSGTD